MHNLLTLNYINKNISKNDHVYITNLKPHEMETLDSFLNTFMTKINLKIPDLTFYMDYFFIGFKIDRIGEEFDLIRFGINYNINIELKSKCVEEKVKKQLLRKEYYLKFLKNNTYHYTYCSDNKELYALSDDKIIKVNFNDLFEKIKQQNIDKSNEAQIKQLFNPNNYLISPFNNTDNFIQKEYFLTQHQNKIKNLISKEIDNNEKNLFFSIEGSAGTGKSLLIYDMMFDYVDKNWNTLMIHCGILNSGHNELIKNYNFNIIPIKDYKEILHEDIQIIFIDEGQRLKQQQLEYISEFCKKNNIYCVFTLDENQCLSQKEIDAQIHKHILNLTNKGNNINHHYNIQNKIRSNASICRFVELIKSIPLNNKSNLNIDDGSITINYFDNIKDARDFINIQEKEGWEHLTYTPSKNSCFLDGIIINNKKNSHYVIGQEFDKVSVIIDKNFKYIKNNEKNTLDLKYILNSYYHMENMLYQNMTRAKNHLNIIIVDNPELFFVLAKLLYIKTY